MAIVLRCGGTCSAQRDDGAIQREDGQGTRLDTDPATGWFERAIVRIGSWLPIEWLL